MKKDSVLVIVGPTASGKTATAIAVAKALDGEIVSADSMQIYKKMRIGTAKPTRKEMDGIPHHLIDIIDPKDKFSVAEYKIKALDTIKQIIQRKKLPIVVGGTGLYINGLTLPWNFSNNSRDKEIYDYYETIGRIKGIDQLYKILIEKDPEAAQKIHPNNVKRVIRALEIIDVSGDKKSNQIKIDSEREVEYNYIMTGIEWERTKLYDRINTRIDMMMTEGLIDEVKELINLGLNSQHLSMQAIGYKELIPYINGEMEIEKSLELLKRDSRRYAKRQLTWFRKDDRINWFSYENYKNTELLASDIANYFLKMKKYKEC